MGTHKYNCHSISLLWEDIYHSETQLPKVGFERAETTNYLDVFDNFSPLNLLHDAVVTKYTVLQG